MLCYVELADYCLHITCQHLFIALNELEKTNDRQRRQLTDKCEQLETEKQKLSKGKKLSI